MERLRGAGVPVSVTEYLTLIGAMKHQVAFYSVEDFYYLARASLVKDERLLDRFDLVFSEVFRGAETLAEPDLSGIPEDWLRKLAEKILTPAEMAQIGSLGGFDKLMETLRQRLAEQKGRHQGGNRWIGTAGISPFGAHGYNPEAVRIGQDGSRHRRAVKVWDKRDFRDLDGDVELGTRGMKLALRRLRRFARQGAATELDLPGTIHATASNAGSLDLKLRPERHNAVKILLLLDIGGSMDDHVRASEALFSAVRGEFKHFEHFYFHNCVYEQVWRENRRRKQTALDTFQVLRSYGPDYKLVFVGDATMSPYEIIAPGGSVEHVNTEPGQVWMSRLLAHFRGAAWLNPAPERFWPGTHSIRLIADLMAGRMYPLTLSGLDQMTRELSR
jgi:uncharacterized protein with von Willebrand factor type A (vWA) domain